MNPEDRRWYERWHSSRKSPVVHIWAGHENSGTFLCGVPVGGEGPDGPVNSLLFTHPKGARPCVRCHKIVQFDEAGKAHRIVRWGRFNRGMTAIAPQRPLYGTTARCECGQEFRTNEGGPSSPAAKRSIQWAFERHVKEA